MPFGTKKKVKMKVKNEIILLPSQVAFLPRHTWAITTSLELSKLSQAASVKFHCPVER